MMGVVLIALGGAVGSVGRYYVAGAVERWLGVAIGAGFPYGTLAVNVIGSAVLGLLVALLSAVFTTTPEIRLFLVVGVLGGFTTFSAFSLDVIALFERNEAGRALLYIALSVVLSAGALYLVLRFVRWVTP
ncbi:MAG: fluoride efflux transporter CrcB [Alphaproteobacteria bacterium]|nr:fluoride efflux transporter CrcB [Alphaproteobacteria bacterium]